MGNDFSDFTQDVLLRSESVPVVVDFWAPWCGPCKVLGPILEKLESEAGGAWKLVKIDTDQQQAIAAEHGIRGIPDVRLYSLGKEVARFSGALPEREVRLSVRTKTSPLRSGKPSGGRQTCWPRAHPSGLLKFSSPWLRRLHKTLPWPSSPPGPKSSPTPSPPCERVERLPATFDLEEGVEIIREFARLFTTADTLEASPQKETYAAGARALQAEQFEDAGAPDHRCSA